MKIFKLIILFFLCYSVEIIEANPIDSLTTKNDVENFIKMHFSEYAIGFTIDDEIYMDIEKKILKKLKYTGWDKIDIDNNGITDLIINGNNTNGAQHILVLAFDKNLFKIVNLPKKYTLFPPYYKGFILSNIPVIFIISTYGYNDSLSTDTLVYKFENFINYNQNPKQYDISELHYYTGMPGMGGYIFDAYINFKTNKNYSNFKIWGNVKDTLTIDDHTIGNIKNILNYMNFANLKDNYSIGMTDLNEVVLEITYDNGKKKKITDYGQWGTYGLNSVYNLIELINLRE